jgi:hypothetical protein
LLNYETRDGIKDGNTVLCHKHKTRLNCSIIENPSFQSNIKITKDEMKSTKSKRQKERERERKRGKERWKDEERKE